MQELIVYGFPVSTYVRSARLILEEKAVPYRNEPVDFTQPDYRKLHPWAKIPVLRHGELVLYETSAILRYGEESLRGPQLHPGHGPRPGAHGAVDQRDQRLHG